MRFNIYDVIYLLSSVFGTYIIYKYFGIFFDRQNNNKTYELLRYISYFLIITFIYFFVNIPVIMMGSNLFLFFLLGFSYCKSIKKSILSAFSIYFILMGIEMVVVLLSGYIDFPVFTVNYYASIFGILSIRILSYTVFLLMINYKHIKKGTQIPTLYWGCIIIMPFSSLYIVLLLFVAKGISIASIIIVIILLILANLSTFYLYDKITIMYEEKIERAHLSSQIRFYNMQLELMQASMRAIRSVRHDLVNHLSAINVLIEEGDNIQASEHIEKLTQVCGDKREYAKSGNIIIDSIINFKLSETEQDNIDVKVQLNIPEKLPLTSFDVAVILGNLLDNAIYATKKLEANRSIELQIYLSKGRLIIKSSNTFNGVLKYNNNNNELLTSKADKNNHGLGLKNIKNAIKNYNGSIDILVDENKFTITVLLYI